MVSVVPGSTGELFSRAWEAVTDRRCDSTSPGASRDQLVLAGVAEERIYLSGLCTAMHLDVLTSYRAEKDRAGRIVAAIRPFTPR